MCAAQHPLALCLALPMSGAFRILHVCTGNLCRSPLAEQLMAAALRSQSPAAAEAFTIGSAGTHARAGGAMEPYALDVLAERGIDGRAFRVRELSSDLVAEAGLVLTATRQHRTRVATLDPTSVGRTFTLREFARLGEVVDAGVLPGVPAGGSPQEHARALVVELARSRRPPARPRDDDLDDPYQRPRRAFARCASEIEDALRVALDLLLPPAPAA